MGYGWNINGICIWRQHSGYSKHQLRYEISDIFTEYIINIIICVQYECQTNIQKKTMCQWNAGQFQRKSSKFNSYSVANGNQRK